jgi:hypothetical protein
MKKFISFVRSESSHNSLRTKECSHSQHSCGEKKCVAQVPGEAAASSHLGIGDIDKLDLVGVEDVLTHHQLARRPLYVIEPVEVADDGHRSQDLSTWRSWYELVGKVCGKRDMFPHREVAEAHREVDHKHQRIEAQLTGEQPPQQCPLQAVARCHHRNDPCVSLYRKRAKCYSGANCMASAHQTMARARWNGTVHLDTSLPHELPSGHGTIGVRRKVT